VLYLDLDVEAPNAAHFLNPEIEERRESGVLVPEVDLEACDHCGRCVEVCAFHALADLKETMLVFPDLCMGCGVCTRHCPQRAIREVKHVLGTLGAGHAGEIEFAQGRLHVGRAQPTPVIRDLKRWRLPPRADEIVAILDAPPGASCPVMEAARGADTVILVAEPSRFGLHDLGKAVGALRDAMGLHVGVVINRSRGHDEAIEAFCRERGLPVLLTIPFDRRIAVAYAEGTSLVEALPEWEAPLWDVMQDLQPQARIA
jgi:MinD superfamily P-loop ATPase